MRRDASAGVVIDEEFAETARRVLAAVRRKGQRISSWKKCYRFEVGMRLENGKTYVLRRQATHIVQNAAKRAAHNLGIVRSKSVDFGQYGGAK